MPQSSRVVDCKGPGPPVPHCNGRARKRVTGESWRDEEPGRGHTFRLTPLQAFLG